MQPYPVTTGKYAFLSANPGPRTPDASAVNNAAVTSGITPGRFSISNPMVWLLGIGAVTIGLVGASTHVRAGSFKASVSAGKSD